jgi:4-hydroxy-tetrahydrodipicolinate synthase
MVMKFTGTGVALVTPFNSQLEVDYEGLTRLVELQIAGGTDFLVVQGTTGETATLSADEKKKVLAHIIEVNAGRLPIVLGLAGNSTAQTVEDFRKQDFAGVDGVLSASPHYNKPSQQGIIAHFEALSAVTDLPIILYNVPGRTGSNMLPSTILKLAEIPNIVAVKEASGNLEQVMEIVQHAPNNFSVLSGEDALTVPMISVGVKGVISVVANAYPQLFSSMITAALQDNFQKASEIHYQLLQVTHAFFAEGNPSGVKAALEIRGICENQLRLPLTAVSEELYKSIQQLSVGLE